MLTTIIDASPQCHWVPRHPAKAVLSGTVLVGDRSWDAESLRMIAIIVMVIIINQKNG